MTKTGRALEAGFTLLEIIITAAILLLSLLPVMVATIQQITLSEHARNLSWAASDASRVLEQIRDENSSPACVSPAAAPPGGFANWDAWLANAATGGGGKSLQPDPANNELLVVTPGAVGSDPLPITVAVCWRHRNRIFGECDPNGAGLIAADKNGDGVITSPATLSTQMTCRRW